MSLRVGIPLVISVLLLSCASDQPSYGSGSGELGKGSLYVTCADDDAACDPGAEVLDAEVPIAVGASFRMRYEGQVPNAPTGNPTNMILFPASPAMLSLDEDLFIGWMPGRVAVMARTEEGTVTDFVHLALVEVGEVQIARSEGEPASLPVGEQGTWIATPRTADGVIVGGSVGYAWEVEGTAVEVASHEGRTVTLTALEPGSATLRAKTGEVTGEAAITVEAAQ